MSKLSSPWILLLVAVLVSALISMAAAASSSEIFESRGIKSGNGGEEKPQKDKRPFFVGSRYGRSQSDLTNMDEYEGAGEPFRVVQRNDRFFLGSRYGKRSSPFGTSSPPLKCSFTGITNIFRCVEIY